MVSNVSYSIYSTVLHLANFLFFFQGLSLSQLESNYQMEKSHLNIGFPLL